MKEILNYILSDIMFITRLPVRVKFEYKSDKGNVKFFAFVGIVLGAVLFGVAYLLKDIFRTLELSTLLTVMLIFLTGGIHLDGLSDSADGLLSYREPSRIIEIMKDSRIGAMGVVAIISVVLMKIAFINTALSENLFFLIFAMTIFGRLSIACACFFGKPISSSRLGAGYIGNISILEFTLTQLFYTATIISFIFLFETNSRLILNYVLSIFFTMFAIIIYSYIFIKSVTKKIGGISGDILGAICEISEATVIPIFLLGVRLCERLLL